MHNTEMPATCVLEFTLEDARSVTRRLCPLRPSLDLAVRPRFGSTQVNVRDISEYGIGLCCREAIPPGTPVLLRLEPQGLQLRAWVVHSTPARDGWYVGCRLAEPLPQDEVSAYVAPRSELSDFS